MHGESSVSVTVVSSDEKINFFIGWEDVDGIQTRSQLVRVNGSISWNIKHLKGISKVEVVLLSKGNFGLLEVLLSVAHVFKTVNELILVINSKDWLSGRRHS